MQKAESTISMPGDSDSDPCREKRRHALPGQGFPLGLWRKEGRRRLLTKGASGTPAKGLDTRGGYKHGESGLCQERNEVYPFSSLMPVTQREAVLLGHSVQGPTTDAQEHGSLRFVAMSLGQGLLSVPPSHRRSSKADCSDTSREPLPTRCRMRLGPGQTVTWTGRPTNTFWENPVIMAVGKAIDTRNRGLLHVV